MQSIGERLEETRKRKGISLREAAEATKIRSDFLSNIEQNKFDFDLPDIYKRGFLKNYARYLKLDVEKILTDYHAQQLSNSRLGKKAGAEWFGKMEIKDSEGSEEVEEPDALKSSPLGRISAKPSNPVPETDEAPDDEESDKTFYMKIGLIFVGTLALVFVVFGLIWAILGSGNDNDATAEVQAPEIRETPSISDSLMAPDEAASANSITLTASGTVYVLVKQKDDNTELYRNTLSQGESVEIQKSGPVDILFTAGEFLTIEHSGERMRPSSSGTAKITIP